MPSPKEHQGLLRHQYHNDDYGDMFHGRNMKKKVGRTGKSDRVSDRQKGKKGAKHAAEMAMKLKKRMRGKKKSYCGSMSML